jgi:hypothetical protein
MMRSLLQILLFIPAIGAAGLMGASAVAATVRPAPARISYPEGRYPELALPGGQHVAVRSLLNITRPMHFGDFIWNEDTIPQGPMLVRVDLSHQMISVFRGGQEIGSAVIAYGSDGTPTPTGRFSILMKDAHYFSHTYQVPMPYTLMLTKDGVAVHGSSVREGWATHGCVGVPMDFARLLFASVKKGDQVFVLPPR